MAAKRRLLQHGHVTPVGLELRLFGDSVEREIMQFLESICDAAANLMRWNPRLNEPVAAE